MAQAVLMQTPTALMEILSWPLAKTVIQGIIGLLSVGGFWKVIELLLHYRSGKRQKQAEAQHLEGQYQSQIIQNQREWGDRLEAQLKEHKQRIQELEAVAEQNQILTRKVAKLQGEVKSLRAENKQLRKQLKKLTTGK